MSGLATCASWKTSSERALALSKAASSCLRPAGGNTFPGKSAGRTVRQQSRPADAGGAGAALHINLVLQQEGEQKRAAEILGIDRRPFVYRTWSVAAAGD